MTAVQRKNRILTVLKESGRTREAELYLNYGRPSVATMDKPPAELTPEDLEFMFEEYTSRCNDPNDKYVKSDKDSYVTLNVLAATV